MGRAVRYVGSPTQEDPSLRSRPDQRGIGWLRHYWQSWICKWRYGLAGISTLAVSRDHSILPPRTTYVRSAVSTDAKRQSGKSTVFILSSPPPSSYCRSCPSSPSPLTLSLPISAKSRAGSGDVFPSLARIAWPVLVAMTTTIPLNETHRAGTRCHMKN